MDLRQTPQYAKYLTSINWTVEKIDGVYYFIRKIPVLGNIIKIQRPQKFNNLVIEQLKKKYKPFQIILEPNLNTKSTVYRLLSTEYGFKKSKSAYLPSKTIHIDLTKSDDALLREMHYKTRYNIKKAKNPPVGGLKVERSNNIQIFADLWQKCALIQRGMIISRKKEIIKLFEAFEKKSDILLCYKKVICYPSKVLQNSPVGGILLVYSDSIGYYMYACSTKEGKKLFAPTILAWEAIKTARVRGMKIFDFEGIYDERYPLKSWLGFSRFKKSFGGNIVEFPPTYIKTRFPI